MKKRILIKIILTVTTVLFSCSYFSCKSPTGPGLKPGSRNYKWTADTLNSPGNLFHIVKLWGSSSTDVWGIGGYNSTGAAQLWHFDGNKWSTYPPPSIPITAIYGFAQDNVWLFSQNSFYHHNGLKWTKYSEHKLEGYDRILMYNIWGLAPNDIYAVGYADHNGDTDIQAVLMHFNGDKWSFLNIPKLKEQFVMVAHQKNSKELIIESVISTINEYTGKVYLYSNGSLKEIYSGIVPTGINYLNGEVLIGIKQKIFIIFYHHLILWKDLSSSGYIGGIYGNNDYDFFATAYEGIGHYNGTDFKILYNSPDLDYFAGTLIDNNLFLPGKNYSTGQNIIVRAKKITN